MANGFQEGASGGISFRMPSFTFGNTNAAPNSGYSFDLPLATIQSFADRALTFTSNNSNANRGFLNSVIDRSQAQVSATGKQAIGYQNRTLDLFGDISGDVRKTVGGGCFITTAICEAENKPDDCEELQTLRHFRDTYMASAPALQKMVDEYYQIAPEIVAAIERREDKEEIYAFLKDRFLRPALVAISEGKNGLALDFYRNMVMTARLFLEE